MPEDTRNFSFFGEAYEPPRVLACLQTFAPIISSKHFQNIEHRMQRICVQCIILHGESFPSERASYYLLF